MTRKERLVFHSCLLAALCAPLAVHATVTTVPEPGSWSLLAMGLAAIVVASIRKRRK
jgi:hypothetical protein